MAETWERCLNDTHDVKELIPELFYLPEMFYNSNEYELGNREDESQVNDVSITIKLQSHITILTSILHLIQNLNTHFPHRTHQRRGSKFIFCPTSMLHLKSE